MNVSDELARASVLDLAGAPVVFDTLYAQRPAVVLFLRHYG
jgi:hypothetical protein